MLGIVLHTYASIIGNMLISVILSTYNNYDTLSLVLDSLARQSDANFEVIIADDGSTKECKTLTTQCANLQPYQCRYIWHEDKGFRLAAIRNLGVRAAQGDYLIFLDGDCLVRKDFIAQHRRLSEKGWFISGKRVDLSENFTKKCITEKLPIQDWQPRRWLLPRLRGDINKINLLLPVLPEIFFLRRRKDSSRGARGCDLSMFSEDFYAVNGFDETFNDWGLEDTELVVRLLNSGIKHKRIRYSVLVYHLWHSNMPMDNIAVENKKRLEKTIKENKTYTPRGIMKSCT